MLKRFANTGTEDYMKSREVRYICLLRSSSLTTSFAKCLTVAKRYNLRMGRVLTTSSETLYGQSTISSGDCLLEIVGLSPTAKGSFLDEASKIGPSVAIEEATASTATVSTVLIPLSPRYQAASGQELFANCQSIERIADCTLCLIKPHIIKGHAVAELLESIRLAGFSTSAFFAVHLTLAFAEELFDGYRNIYSNYSASMEHLCSSQCLAVMITGAGEDLVTSFRELVGPLDPQLAKAIRPRSLRALFGQDVVRNAVHCTDLAEDGAMECKYFFDTLARL